MKHDPEVLEIVQNEVWIFILHMSAIYLGVGFLLAGLSYLWGRATGGREFWKQRAFLVGGSFAWMSLRGTVLWPRLYLSYPGGEWIANTLTPTQIDVAFGALVAGWLIWHARIWRPHPAWLLSLGLALLGMSWMDDHPPAPTPQKNAGPNVVLIGIDALRPDHLASRGYHRDTAPALEDFLADAAVFDDAFTPQARTWPAWMSILTGAMPEVHGQRDSLPAPGRERPAVQMLTDALVDAGVHTRFVTDDSRFSYMLPDHNFDVIDQPPVHIRAFAPSRYQPHFRLFFHLMNGPLGWSLAPFYRYNQAFGATWRPDHFAEHLADQLAEAAEHDQFFLAAHLCSLHTPADRPWPYHRMYGQPEVRDGNRWRYRSTGSMMADGEDAEDTAALEAVERRTAQQNLNLYDSGIAMVDLIWARLARAMDEGGLWEDTLVIVLSDHGEEFYEEGVRYSFRGPNHGFHPWGTGQYKVLMAIKGPGFEAGARPERVSLIDVAPTIARYLGVSLPEAEGLPMQETVPDRLLFGETGVSEGPYWAEGHMDYPFERAHHRYTLDPETLRVYQPEEHGDLTTAARDRWAIDFDLWLVEEAMIEGPRYSLYRWQEDPLFTVDVSAEEPEAFDYLKAALQRRDRGVAPEALEQLREEARARAAEAGGAEQVAE